LSIESLIQATNPVSQSRKNNSEIVSRAYCIYIYIYIYSEEDLVRKQPGKRILI
jgi:hypothetical protein